MPDKIDDRFSKREWLIVSLLLVVVQGAIWYIAFVNAGSGSALNYVSFAGTLISIILAVLAIGYTYGESVAQKNNSDTTINQIGALNEAVKNIEDSSKSLDKISYVSDKFEAFSEKFDVKMEENKKSFESVRSNVEILLQESQYDKRDDEHLGSEDLVLSGGKNLPFILDTLPANISLFLLYNARNKEFISSTGGSARTALVSRITIDCVDKAKLKMPEATTVEVDDYTNMVLGGLMVYLDMVTILELVSFEGNTFKISEQFKKEALTIRKGFNGSNYTTFLGAIVASAAEEIDI